ncbi:flagellar hook-associated protein FlgK [Sphingomonas cavernae]|uniref:Flagellar hook-associated protein 1 n=1 Tax=Sphingomonas cavernae TaxID=2320861 RepID=A0A418WPU4_9SPHN|nr:flagellar hook-associated protein FlgK [Sphingomonas cavernae]RJF93243.1 flagellar hook-associated protein FlgK [Sphingomonas cavernae]
MSDLLRIGAMGVSVYRNALTTVGDNVANAQSEGYSRRDIKLRETGILGAGQPFYNDKFTVGGVRVTSIERSWDAFRAADARLTNSDSAQSQTRLRWLNVTETALDDGPAGIGQRLTAFYNAADALAGDPGGAAPRRAMLAALQDVANAFHTGADGLARAAEGIATEAQTTVAAVNNELQALADVNVAIARSQPSGAGRASLEDERDRLLDSLSTKIQIDYAISGKGEATVRARGTTTPNLVAGPDAGIVMLQTAADGRLSLMVTAEGSTDPLPVMAGSMAGLVDASNAVAGRRQELDALAADFAAQLNSWSAAGTDKADNPGAAMLSGATAAALQVVMTDPDGIAAAGGGTENGNLLALQAQRGDTGPEARMSNMINILAQQLASAKTQDAALTTRRDNAFAAREEVSGVDLDREAAELIRYQQAYDASSKIIQVARETLQSILAIF